MELTQTVDMTTLNGNPETVPERRKLELHLELISVRGAGQWLFKHNRRNVDPVSLQYDGAALVPHAFVRRRFHLAVLRRRRPFRRSLLGLFGV